MGQRALPNGSSTESRLFLPEYVLKTFVRVLNGVAVGQEISLDQPMVTCGRHAGSDLVLIDDNVSRNHCQFVFNGESECRVEDVGSSNGTYVNDVLVRSKALAIGDQIRVGSTLLEIASCSKATNASLPMERENVSVDELDVLVDPSSGFDTAKPNLDSQVESYSETSDNQIVFESDLDLDFVYRASLLPSKNLTLSNLCRNLMSQVCQWANTEQGLLVLLDKNERDFSRVFTADNFGEDPASTQLAGSSKSKYNRELVERVIECRLPTLTQFEVSSNPVSAMCVPIDNGEKLLGLIYVDNFHCDGDPEATVFSKAGLRDLAAIGKQAAAALENITYVQAAMDIARNEAVAQLTSAVSHRINNLLYLISGSEFLIDSGLKAIDLNQTAQAWGTIRRTLSQINQLSINMAMHCREFSPLMKELKLHKVIEVVAGEMGADYGLTRIQIDHRTASDLAIKLDAHYLERALKNMLSIALMASENGESDQNVVSIETSLSGDSVVIRFGFRHFDDRFELVQLCKSEINKVIAGHGVLEMLVGRKIIESQAGTIACFTDSENQNSIEIRFPLTATN